LLRSTSPMPWNDNANPGPWGAPPSGDDGRKPPEPPTPLRPNGGPRKPPPTPDLESMIRRLAERVAAWFRAPGGRGVRAPAVGAAAALVFLAWMLTGLYIV